MTALIAFLLTVVANTTPTPCATYDIQDDLLLCNGEFYPIELAHIVHDSDDGDIMAVGVWQ